MNQRAGWISSGLVEIQPIVLGNREREARERARFEAELIAGKLANRGDRSTGPLADTRNSRCLLGSHRLRRDLSNSGEHCVVYVVSSSSPLLVDPLARTRGLSHGRRSLSGFSRREGQETLATRVPDGEYLIKILITGGQRSVSPSTDSHDAVYKIVNIIIYIAVIRDR